MVSLFLSLSYLFLLPYGLWKHTHMTLPRLLWASFLRPRKNTCQRVFTTRQAKYTCIQLHIMTRNSPYRSNFARVFLSELVDEGLDHAAWTAPRRPKVDEHRDGRLENFLLPRV